MEMHFFYAYIDAGTGSILVQLLAGGAVAVLVFFRQIKLLLGRAFRRSKKEVSPDE